MAMTKKEQAEFEAMRLERDMAKALRCPICQTPSRMFESVGEIERLRAVIENLNDIRHGVGGTKLVGYEGYPI